ncbi:hypothetical protein J437_LFUL008546, partial [Ladona fulva]
MELNIMAIAKESILISPSLWKNAGSGCSVMEIKFSRPSKVFKIMFRNHYTASICCLINCYKRKDEKQNYDKKDYTWILGITKTNLMSHPHYEEGGTSHFSLFQPYDGYLLGIRLVLKQPSQKWEKFFIHQVSLSDEIFPLPEI